MKLALAAAVAVFAATAATASAQSEKAQSPCALLTPAQIQPLAGTAVKPGTPGPNNDCTWRDQKNQDRVYLALKDATNFHDFRAQMQSSGRMSAIPGLAEDAFIVSSAGSSAALYLLKKKHLIELMITGPDFSRAQNEAAEQALAPKLLAHF
jgi:hypothetical protein